MGKIKFTPVHFEEIIKKGYSMDQIVLLTWIQEKLDLTDLLNCGSPKISALYQSLNRKGLINNDATISTLGEELLTYINTENPPKLLRRKPIEKKTVVETHTSSDFDRWWDAYPATNTFNHKGIQFDGDRSLRAKKDDCRVKLNKILAEGEYTIDEMIKALEFEVLQKKEASVKERTNKLKYMQNSLTYLNQYTYESFIDLIRKGVQVKETSQVSSRGGTDI